MKKNTRSKLTVLLAVFSLSLFTASSANATWGFSGFLGKLFGLVSADESHSDSKSKSDDKGKKDDKKDDKSKGKDKDDKDKNKGKDDDKDRGHDHDGPGKGHKDHGNGKGKGHNHDHDDDDDDHDWKDGWGKHKDHDDHDWGWKKDWGWGKHKDHDDDDDDHHDDDDDYGNSDGTDVPLVDGNCAIYRAGQHIVVGSVCVTLEGDNLLVDYILEDGWQLSEPHLWVGETLDTAPRTSKGSPIPGQFPYTASVMGVSTHTFTIPVSDLGIDPESYCADPSKLLVGAHGVVSKSGQTESAWAGETRFTKKGNWATYFGVNAECTTDDDDDDDDNGGGGNDPELPQGCYITNTSTASVPLTFDPFGFAFQNVSLTDAMSPSDVYGSLLLAPSQLGVGFSLVMSPAAGYEIRTVDFYAGAAGTYNSDVELNYSFSTATAPGAGAIWTGTPVSVAVPLIPVTQTSDVAIFATICEEGVDATPN